jgi:anti-sigma factor RsiW
MTQDTETQQETNSAQDARIDARVTDALDAFARQRAGAGLPAAVVRAARRAERFDRMARMGATAAAAVLVFAGGWLAGGVQTGAGPGASEAPAELVQLGGLAVSDAPDAPTLLSDPVLSPPQLTGHGLHLTASIARTAQGGAFNALEYKASGGETVRILARRISPAGPGTLQHAHLDGERLVWWREGDLVIGVTGPLARPDLEAIAQTVRSQSRPPMVADFTPAPELGVQTVNDPGG